VFTSVVFGKEGLKPTIESHHGFVASDVDVVILHRAPEPLDHDVVQCSPLAIHADLHIMGLQHIGEGFAGELTALGSVLKISGAPSFCKASSRHSMQNNLSMLLLRRKLIT